MRISAIRHPEYNLSYEDYEKWRLTYQGGRNFIERYLVKFSKREDTAEFNERKCMAHAPTFAKGAINKLIRSFYSRMGEIARLNGSQSYRDSVAGKGGGVDLYGSSMNRFIAECVLPEMTTMRQVGVYIDRPQLSGNLLAQNRGNQPYLYIYRAEDILTWKWTYYSGEYVFLNVLLRDFDYKFDENTGMTTGYQERYRQLWLAEDGKVHVKFWVVNPDEKEEQDIQVGEEVILDLPRIPFVVMGLKESLLCDVADYQIGMLNLASADLNYVKNANFPLYVEPFDPVAESVHIRRPLPPPRAQVDATTAQDPAEGTAAVAQRSSRNDDIQVGTLHGRRYPKGLDAPSFIAPPTEPLLASMKKQEQMKADIYELVDIAAANAVPQHASAESKQMDDRGLESGLSAIGMELEWGEREIAKIWALYENAEPATIKYPEKYTLKSDAQRLDEAGKLNEVKMSAPSRTFSKEVGKRIARVMLSDKVTDETLVKIDKEIDAADFITSDPDALKIAMEGGIVDAVTASNAFGFDGEKVVPKAQEEHAKRLALIAESQAKGAARGNPDAAPTQGADAQAKGEKTASQSGAKDGQPNPAVDKTRGNA